MKREYPETPLVGVGAVILDQGRVVLVKRKFPPLAGDWSIPGGRLKIGETLREGVVREAREETGLTIDPVELLGVYDRLLLDEAGRILYHYVLIDFLCRRLTGELQASGDADDARWFSPEEIEKVSLVADTAQVIRLGFEKVGK
jgi:ADP-ribose pyrophosphatase YjhB (NUDIX family)